MADITITAEALRTLHRIHQQLGDLRERLERGPRLQKAHVDNVARLEAAVEAAKAQAKNLRVSVDDKQVQLKGREEGVQKRRQQLREAKSNKEYSALQEQIEADEMTNSVLADEVLEGLERLDGGNKKVAEAQAALAQGQKEAQAARAEYEKTAPAIHAEAERLLADLQKAEQDLPPDFLEAYRRVIRSKGSDALAPIHSTNSRRGESAPSREDEYFCGGCHRQTPVNEFNALLRSQPVFCKSCGRLLYVPEGMNLPRR